MNQSPARKAIPATVLLAALGYFVDLYDLLLFSIVRVKSLKELGVAEPELLTTGVSLLNMQMGGMLLGGLLWGILGDKKGRLSVLFGSIFLYSAANIASGCVHSVQVYAWLRLLAGIGLAGELGAGITLVSEIMSKETRGYGTMIVAGSGFLGGIAAAVVGDMFQWRTAYFIGGAMGLALLALRIGVYESGLFDNIKQSPVERGNFWMIFRSRQRAFKYLCCILIGLPIWYGIGILITFSPEMGKALSMAVPPQPAKAVLYFYVGSAIGDFASGSLSQYFRSRKKIMTAFLLLMGAAVAFYLTRWNASPAGFYAACVGLGLATGYWAIFVTIASEQFGTNIRATVTTTAPNFVRGATVPITSAFKALKLSWGVIPAAGMVGAATILLALGALSRLEETYGKDLDYCED